MIIRLPLRLNISGPKNCTGGLSGSLEHWPAECLADGLEHCPATCPTENHAILQHALKQAQRRYRGFHASPCVQSTTGRASLSRRRYCQLQASLCLLACLTACLLSFQLPLPAHTLRTRGGQEISWNTSWAQAGHANANGPTWSGLMLAQEVQNEQNLHARDLLQTRLLRAILEIGWLNKGPVVRRSELRECGPEFGLISRAAEQPSRQKIHASCRGESIVISTQSLFFSTLE